MILIVGGAGYIGSHVNKELNKKGQETVILDDLSTGKKELVKWGDLIVGNLGDEKILDEIFTKYPIEAVMHFAAFKNVGESVTNPERFYLNNLASTLVLLKKMRAYKVNKFIFSSSAATFGNPVKVPIDESHPQNPINPYGKTKLMIEEVLKDYDLAYGLKSVSLRYFNAAGADVDGEVGEWPGTSSNLIPLVLEAAMGTRENIKVFGTDYPTTDGTCIRDYVHVTDLASAHIKALEYLEKGGDTNFFNLGSGKGNSVKEVIDMAKKVTGIDFKVVETSRREGDPAVLVADSQKATKILGWQAKYGDLKIIVESAWKWNQKLAK